MNERLYSRETSSAGAALARAREAQSLSVPEVARHLKISPAQVEALEAGAYDRLPGRVFVRGFLRNYAKLVKIDPEPLLRTIEREMPQPAPASEPSPTREVTLPVRGPSRWPHFAAFAFVVAAALAIYEFGFNQPEHDPAEPAVQTPAPTDASAPASPSPPTVRPKTPSASEGGTPVKSASTAAGSAETAVPGQGTLRQADVDLTAGATVGTPRPGERQLHFRFDEDSWVEIRDRDNKVIFSKLNRAGAEERVNGVPPLKLIVGNARNVHLTYGERPVDLTPHIGVTVARMTVE